MFIVQFRQCWMNNCENHEIDKTPFQKHHTLLPQIKYSSQQIALTKRCEHQKCLWDMLWFLLGMRPQGMVSFVVAASLWRRVRMAGALMPLLHMTRWYLHLTSCEYLPFLETLLHRSHQTYTISYHYLWFINISRKC